MRGDRQTHRYWPCSIWLWQCSQRVAVCKLSRERLQQKPTRQNLDLGLLGFSTVRKSASVVGVIHVGWWWEPELTTADVQKLWRKVFAICQVRAPRLETTSTVSSFLLIGTLGAAGDGLQQEGLCAQGPWMSGLLASTCPPAVVSTWGVNQQMNDPFSFYSFSAVDT